MDRRFNSGGVFIISFQSLPQRLFLFGHQHILINRFVLNTTSLVFTLALFKSYSTIINEVFSIDFVLWEIPMNYKSRSKVFILGCYEDWHFSLLFSFLVISSSSTMRSFSFVYRKTKLFAIHPILIGHGCWRSSRFFSSFSSSAIPSRCTQWSEERFENESKMFNGWDIVMNQREHWSIGYDPETKIKTKDHFLSSPFILWWDFFE